jgi:hypothetical protein
VKFIKLSALRQHPRLPRFQDVRRDLVDYREIEAFALQGAVPVWGGDDVFSDSPCVFVSHRWQSPTHPDPDGAQKATIVDRLNQVDLRFRGFGGSREDKRSRTANARRGVSGGSAPGAEMTRRPVRAFRGHTAPLRTYDPPLVRRVLSH